MNIELGIGIGSGTLASPTSNDRLVAFAWAMAGTPNVSTSTVIHKSITSVPATSNISALVPIVSNADNVTVIAVIANTTCNVLVPNVAIAGSISVNAVVANSNSNGVIPIVSTIRNVSVGGVIANSTASAGVPTVSVGGGSSYYLQMDGVDDYLKTPSVAFNELIIDMNSEAIAVSYYFDYRTGSTSYMYWNNATNDIAVFTTITGTIYVDDVDKSAVADKVPQNQRLTLRVLTSSDVTDDVTIFGKNDGTTNMKGKLYSVKFLNSGTVVAHYDMSTGTVQDQSGNGNHATLTGGTWVVA